MLTAIALLLLAYSSSAHAFNVQVLLDLHCQKEHDISGDDEPYVVSSTIQNNGQPDSRFVWAGNMNDDGRKRDVSGLLVWAGTINPGEVVAVNVHVFEQNGSDYNSGTGFGQRFAQEGAGTMVNVPLSSDLSAFLNALNPTYLADRSFQAFIRGHSDSYPGTYTVMIGINVYGFLSYFYYPTYRARWTGDAMALDGDGATYLARTRVSIY